MIRRYREMERMGSLRANDAFTFAQPEDGALYECYRWMAEQMTLRLGPPPSGTHFPVWAWYWWRGKKHPRPNLRSSGHGMRGERFVRITFNAPSNAVVLSNFDAYTIMFNGDYVPLNEADDSRFESEYKECGYTFHDLQNLDVQTDAMLQLRGELRESWQRIFSTDLADDNYLYGRADEQIIQATLWEIPLKWVDRVEHFTAR